MHGEIGSLAAGLALPMIARQHLQPKLLVVFGIKPLSSHGWQDPGIGKGI
jgi:hypothetical protein